MEANVKVTTPPCNDSNSCSANGGSMKSEENKIDLNHVPNGLHLTNFDIVSSILVGNANNSNCTKSEGVTSSKENADEFDYAPNGLHVTKFDIVALIISIFSHIFDVALDINLAYRYYRSGQMWYFGLTTLFILFPAVTTTIISITMYTLDEDSMSVSKIFTKKWVIRILVFLLQLAPVLRYCDSLAYAFKARRAEKCQDRYNQSKYYKLMLKEDSDVALLRVFECFLEAAPQQILQTTILLVDSRQDSTFQLLHQTGSIASSLLSMSWSMAAYHRSIRFVQDNKDNISLPGTVMQFLWHFMITVSRILSISVVASSFASYTAIGCAAHMCMMALWISLLDRAHFCRSKLVHPCCQNLAEYLFSFILGMVYVFTYITPGKGRTRHRYIVYYSICFIENAAAVGTWAAFANTKLRQSWYFYPLLIGSVSSFVLGIAFMIIYYLYFHPKPLGSKDIRLKTTDSSVQVDIFRSAPE